MEFYHHRQNHFEKMALFDKASVQDFFKKKHSDVVGEFTLLPGVKAVTEKR
jgi:hypothetical protein